MKLVQLTGELSKRFGDRKALDMIKQAGFDGFDYSMFTKNATEILLSDGYKEYFADLRNYSEKIGLPCLQTHSPSEFSMLDENEAKEYIRISIRSIEATAILGSKIVVIHPEKWFSAEKNKELLYDKLLPTAKRLGVIIATENMFRWKDEKCEETAPGACGTAKDFVRHIDLISDANFKACLDLGHAQMINCEGAVALINALKNRICALHVHDNDLCNDDHAFPFIGDSNWSEICSALKGIGYSGHFTFEADATLKKYPDELMEDCLRLLHSTGRYLIKLITQ